MQDLENPYVRNVRLTAETHKALKTMAVQLGCRVDVLNDFVVDQYLKKHDLADIDQNKDYKKIVKKFSL